MSVMIEASFHASKIIERVHLSADLKKEVKKIEDGIEDPVTEADLRV